MDEMIDGHDDYKNRMEEQGELEELRLENKNLKVELRKRWERIENLDARVRALLDDNQTLTKEDEERNEQWLKTYHDVEARTVYHEAATATMKIQIEELDKELATLRDLDQRIVLENDKLRKENIRLTEALTFYSDKDNLERYIKIVERWRPNDPDYRHTEATLYDGVTKVANDAINK
jgi:DNA repair exonuclease SbcCD ATPase subunit